MEAKQWRELVNGISFKSPEVSPVQGRDYSSVVGFTIRCSETYADGSYKVIVVVPELQPPLQVRAFTIKGRQE